MTTQGHVPRVPASWTQAEGPSQAQADGLTQLASAVATMRIGDLQRPPRRARQVRRGARREWAAMDRSRPSADPSPTQLSLEQPDSAAEWAPTPGTPSAGPSGGLTPRRPPFGRGAACGGGSTPTQLDLGDSLAASALAPSWSSQTQTRAPDEVGPGASGQTPQCQADGRGPTVLAVSSSDPSDESAAETASSGDDLPLLSEAALAGEDAMRPLREQVHSGDDAVPSYETAPGDAGVAHSVVEVQRPPALARGGGAADPLRGAPAEADSPASPPLLFIPSHSFAGPPLWPGGPS